MSDDDIIDVEFTEVRPRPSFNLILVDRLAIVLGILFTGAAALYAYGGLDFALASPDQVFVRCMKLMGSFVGVVWLGGRLIDFLVTGRVRH